MLYVYILHDDSAVLKFTCDNPSKIELVNFRPLLIYTVLTDIYSHRTVFGIYLLRILQILTSAPAIRVKMAVHVRTSSTDFPVPALNTSMERFVNSVTIKTKI